MTRPQRQYARLWAACTVALVWRAAISPAGALPFESSGSSYTDSPAGMGDALAQAAESAPRYLELDESIIESSPVLQRWLNETPDLLDDIRRDPAFSPRLRLGYLRVPADDGDDGVIAGIEDIILTQGGLTLSGEYRGTLDGDRYSAGGELRYYLLPLGRRINLAPVLGYRAIRTPRETVEGAAVGIRLLLVPSRTGAVDIALAQTLVNPGGGEEASLFTASTGYALTQRLRVAADIQIETISKSETQIAVILEWIP